MTNSISSEGVGREIDALLFALTRQLSSYREAQLAPFDLTYPQAQVLCSLTIPLPMNELADRLHCTGSNVTGIVDRLEARGLLQRRAFAADRRVKQLALTDAGVTLQREVDAIMSAFPSSTAGSHTDLLQMRDLLRRFLGRMLDETPHALTTGAWAREQNCREGH